MSEASTPYWAAAARGSLVLQRCADCGELRHYPRPMCPHCQSFEVGTIESTRRGTVHSWTVTQHVFDPSVTSEVPYALVTVDLDEGVRGLARLDGEGGGLAVGRRVRVEFDTTGDVPLLRAVLDQDPA